MFPTFLFDSLMMVNFPIRMEVLRRERPCLICFYYPRVKNWPLHIVDSQLIMLDE